MKLKNKRTGEIKEWDFGNWYQHIMNPDNKEAYECTLSEFIDRTVEFREEWEDYEEPKEYWYIADNGEIEKDTDEGGAYEEKMKEIGNHFETREEAEKAVDKLKAWKRLKDKGFRFGISGECDNTITYGISITFSDYYDNDETRADLDLLFGGEE